MKMEIIIQQDDCAPDSLKLFERKFKEFTGMSIQEFKEQSEITNGCDFVEYKLNDYFLSYCADDPYWKLFKN